MMSKLSLAFQNKSSTQTRTERPALCPSSLWPHARPAPERAREAECARGYVCVRGEQTFPWQDPQDPMESRVQPVKERLHARQSISSSHLHNKWSSHGFSSTHTRTHTRAHADTHTSLISVSTQRSSAHANARSAQQGGR